MLLGLELLGGRAEGRGELRAPHPRGASGRAVRSVSARFIEETAPLISFILSALGS